MDKFLFLFVIALSGTRASSVNDDGDNRMLEGTVANENQFRYMVSLQKISEIESYTRGHRCGGALLTLQHAITAASCNYEQINGASIVINPSEYRVFSGAVSLTNDQSLDRYRLITNITVHPEYHSSTRFVNDIAIILLVSAFTPATSTPVEFPLNDAGFLELSQINPCYVSGWGAQNVTAHASVQLMYLQKQLQDRAVCRAYYGSLMVGQLNIVDSMVCAVGVQQQTQFAGCTGDIGNPLVCSIGEHFYLNGILIRSKNCTVSADPEVYTRIAHHSTWINSVIAPGAASTFQPRMAVLAVIAIAQIVTANVIN